MLRTSRGFTIIESLVAVAIGSIAIAGVVAMVEQVSVSQSTQKYGYESNNLTEEVRTALGSNASCFNTFKNIQPNTIVNTSVNFPGPIFNDANVPVYQVGQVYGDRAVKLQSMKLSNYGSSNAFGGVISLLLNFSSMAPVNGGKSLLRTINLQVTTNAGGNLTACISQGKATDGLWKITPTTNTDIYYAGGNVGIGVTAAAYPFQVAAGTGGPNIEIANLSGNVAANIFSLNNSSAAASIKSAIMFKKNQVSRFETGIDIAQNGSQNYYIWDATALAARLFINPNGYIGIGNTSPTVPVSVGPNILAPLDAAEMLQVGRTGDAYITAKDGTGTAYIGSVGGVPFAGSYSNTDFMLRANNSEKMRITPAGNVGIGTATPVSPLHLYSPSEGNIIMGRGYDFQFDGGNDQYFVFNNFSGITGQTSFNGAGHQFFMMKNLNGFVGINSGTPNQQLDVNGDIGVGGTNALRRDGSNAYLFPWGTGYANNNLYLGGGSKANLVIPQGSISIGAANAYGAPIEIHQPGFGGGQAMILLETNHVQAAFNLDTSSSNVGVGQIGTITDNGFQLYTNNIPRLTIDNLGHVSVGDNMTVSKNLRVMNNATFYGCVYYPGGNVGSCPSDQILKDHVRPFTSSLDQVLGLKPVWFRYNGKGGTTLETTDRLGFIAQDVEKVAPELVGTKVAKLYPGDKTETEFKTVNYSAFLYMVINALKEFYLRWSADHLALEELQKQNAALKAQVDRQARDIADIKKKLGLAF